MKVQDVVSMEEETMSYRPSLTQHFMENSNIDYLNNGEVNLRFLYYIVKINLNVKISVFFMFNH